MELSPLTAISPVDGRYSRRTEALRHYFSEFALMNYRVKVEIEYFIALCEIPLAPLKDFPREQFETLRMFYDEFSEADAAKIKDAEAVTNHDVKAVEYFLKQYFDMLGLSAYKEFIHFGLTSQDINNTAFPLMIKEAIHEIYLPQLNLIISLLTTYAGEWKEIPMLSRTHGQPASPTILGKEIYVFVERLNEQVKLLNTIPFNAKFGGAVGNFNAHHAAFPDIFWIDFANIFVREKLGLQRQQFTTQIEHYDNLAALFDCLKRINTILIDLCRDMWQYISMDYFKQKIKEGEVGSSAMPHKVNPIDFENAEGNFGIANALLEHLSAKLPTSRLQRDLTDSTVLRNVGVPFAHTGIAFDSLLKGLNKLILNEQKLHADLDNNWAVVSEAIQTVLRREGYDKPYEALKALTRTNDKVNKKQLHDFIDSLNVNDKLKKELKQFTPFNYTGIFPNIPK
jgi:adenylosuccinate lyase